MANDWGITAEDGKAYLAGGKTVHVRTRSKGTGSAPHAGKAILLEILNDKTARIRPAGGHKKNEVVELSSLKFWKSMNAAKGVHMIARSEPLPVLAGMPPILGEFCIVSRNRKAIWSKDGGGWGNTPVRATVFPNKEVGDAEVKRIISTAPDATLLTKEAAFSLIGELYPKIAPRPQQPKPTSSSIPLLDLANLGIDLDTILGDDGRDLQVALNARRKAAEDVRDAQKLLQDAAAALIEAQERVNRLSGWMKPATPQAQDKPDSGKAPRTYTKRGALSGAVKRILTESSRLSQDAIIDKVIASVDIPNGDKRARVLQTMYDMKSREYIGRDEQGNYFLTEKGKTHKE